MTTNFPELRKLVDRLLDNDPLSRPEMARLEELLDDDRNLEYYLELTQQEAVLPEALSRMPMESLPQRSQHFRLLMPLVIAAAACAIFVAGLQVGSWRALPDTAAADSTAPGGPNARITGLMGVQWSAGNAPDLLGNSGAFEKLAIDSGLVEITYHSGVRVTVEGPAEFTVIDPFSGNLARGKLVASVPKGAEGFRIDYADGSVVDLGTEFAMDVRPGISTEVGVFNGEIELHTANREPMALYKNHAVKHDREDSENPIQTIPFNRDKFVRSLPSRDFAWEIRDAQPAEIEFDVTHLVWKASEYRAIFKWMNGADGIEIDNVELRLNGLRVASDPHHGSTGRLPLVTGNLFRLDVGSDRYAAGRWTVHVTLKPLPREGPLLGYTGPVRSSGILQFEEGLVTSATAEDFVGKWNYRDLGRDYLREFLPDGTIRFFRDGVQPQGLFAGSRWIVVDGILEVTVPEIDGVERHALRDRNTLISISQPYENAVRVR